MPTQAATSTVQPIMRILPAPQMPDSPDPVPAMRREISLLRIELDRARQLEDEANRANEFLVAQFDRLMDSRDRWRREAQRVGALYEEMLATRRGPLFWWRSRAR
jgi:hypothetical protein